MVGGYGRNNEKGKRNNQKPSKWLKANSYAN